MKNAKRWALVLVILVAFITTTYLVFVATDGKVCDESPSQEKYECARYKIASFGVFYWLRFFDLYNGLMQALASIAVGLFTFYLMRIGQAQAQISSKQVDLETKQFIATHRPKLIVRNVWVHFNRPQPEGPEQAHVCFTIVNIGATVAKSIAGEMGVAGAGNVPMLHFFMDCDHTPLRPMAGGEMRSFRVSLNDRFSAHFAAMRTITFAQDPPIEIGLQINYADTLDVGRETSIHRRYVQPSKQFELVDKSDREYAD